MKILNKNIPNNFWKTHKKLKTCFLTHSQTILETGTLFETSENENMNISKICEQSLETGTFFEILDVFQKLWKIEQNHSEQLWKTRFFENPEYFKIYVQIRKHNHYFKFKKREHFFRWRGFAWIFIPRRFDPQKATSLYTLDSCRVIIKRKEGYDAGVKELRLALIKWNCWNRAWWKN